tara:strand:- start:13537 stop:14118 length:582 start_codon:yes stop_codon:yes gene_type:complete
MYLNKKAAIELSIGTIVVIVLAMTMLILGLVLIQNIFRGATDNVSELNDKVKDEIRSLFQDESQRVQIKLTEDTANMEQGEEFGVAFGIKNIYTSTQDTTTFKYEVELDDANIVQGCGVSEQTALSWVRLGSGQLSIPPGQVEFDRIVFQIPEEAPLCTTKYRIKIWDSTTGSRTNTYSNPFFIVKIESSGLF